MSNQPNLLEYKMSHNWANVENQFHEEKYRNIDFVESKCSKSKATSLAYLDMSKISVLLCLITIRSD